MPDGDAGLLLPPRGCWLGVARCRLGPGRPPSPPRRGARPDRRVERRRGGELNQPGWGMHVTLLIELMPPEYNLFVTLGI